jgi:hypothetical protein
VGGLIIPDWYALQNSVSSLNATEQEENRGINSYYGSLSFGLNRMVFIDVTARYDISSTLPEESNSYFYPSVSASFILTELGGLSDLGFLSFAKIRANYAQVGADAPAYRTLSNYAAITPYDGHGMFSVPTTLNNPDLKPERTNSMEAGIEARFWQNRLGIDISLYNNNTFDQIMPIDISRAAGYSFMYINAGEIQNQGIELALNGTPVQSSDFTWDINVNWWANRNEVVSLGDQIDNILLFSAWDVSVNAREGEPYGSIMGTDFIWDGDKKVVYDDTGARPGYYMFTSGDTIIGNINPDWNMGINNALNFKGISLNFLVDIQKGGDIYSVNTKYGRGTGVYEETAGNNDKGNPKRDPVDEGGGVIYENTVYPDGTENTTYIPAWRWGRATYYGYLPTAEYVLDASYVKLREVSLGYSLPKNLISKTPFSMIQLSLVSRNLWIIHKNTYHFDPEAALTSGNQQGIESGSYPTARTVGFNLKLGL